MSFVDRRPFIQWMRVIIELDFLPITILWLWTNFCCQSLRHFSMGTIQSGANNGHRMEKKMTLKIRSFNQFSVVRFCVRGCVSPRVLDSYGRICVWFQAYHARGSIFPFNVLPFYWCLQYIGVERSARFSGRSDRIFHSDFGHRSARKFGGGIIFQKQSIKCSYEKRIWNEHNQL